MELLRTLHSLEGDKQTQEERDVIEEEGRKLLEFGFTKASNRVVCKRPKSAPPVGNIKVRLDEERRRA